MHGPPTTEETHQIEALTQTVEELRRRVAALEEWAASAAVSAKSLPTPAPTTIPSFELPEVTPGLLAVLGRVLLGIAGAYLLRAITEAGIVPHLTGTILGLVYTSGWLASTLRIPIRNPLVVAIHGITAAAIVAPLLWEATLRFHTMSASASASALALFVILGQACAWQHEHSALAAVTASAGAATALGLIIATLNPVPFAIALTATAAAVELGAWRDRALGWRWIIAFACDLCAVLLVYLVTRKEGLPEGYAPVTVAVVIGLLIALFAVYVASISTRTLVRGTIITSFELAQIVTVASLAMGGALRISHGAHTIFLGVLCLVFGALCYLVSFSGLVAARDFHAYATFATLLVLAGGLLMRSQVAWLWIGTAVVLSTTSRITFTMHSALYLLAATALQGWSVNVGAFLNATALAITFVLILHHRRDGALHWTSRVPAAVIAALLCWTLANLSARFLIPASMDPPFAATLRSGIIAVIAIALAWFGSRKNLRELIWVLFPWMILGAVKLAYEDFPQGRSATLFLSLLLYGGTLIALPRLLRRRATRSLEVQTSPNREGHGS